MKTVTPGYVLIVTMMIVAASMILVMSIAQKTMAYKSLSRYAYSREKAKMLALSGVQIACSQLGDILIEKDEQKQMNSLLMLIDRKQTFTLKEERDGIDGECEITLLSEQGKININALYDFKAKKFITDKTFDGKKVMQLLCDKLQPFVKEKDLLQKVEKFLKERSRPLDDVTELLEVVEYKVGKEEEVQLRDIATVFPSSYLVQPLLLSPAVGKMFGLKNWSETEEGRKKQIQDLSKKIKPTLEWAQEWNGILGSVYGKEYAVLPAEFRSILNTKFEAQWISVVSYGTYNTVTQKICAVLEKEISQKKETPSAYYVRRLYWL